MAETVDHVPNRACFPRRAGPEGFEFPACGKCQNLYRAEEHYFAFVCRVSDQDNANYDSETSRRLISGIRNNLPHLLPQVGLSANEKRKALRKLGLKKPQGASLNDMPIAAFPPESDAIIRKVAIKLGLALFYRQKGYPASLNYNCTSYWTQASDVRTMEVWKEVGQEITGVEWGKRSNLNFGNRFRYGWASEAEGSPDIFISIAEFGMGLAVCSMIWNPDISADVEVNFGSETISVENWASRSFSAHWPRGAKNT